MITDLMNKPQVLALGEKDYTMDFDNRAFGVLEQNTGKSIFQIYDELVMSNSLGFNDRVEIACCAMMKNHTEAEIEQVRKELNEHKYLLMKNLIPVTLAFMVPLTPPEVLNQQTSKPSKPVKNQSKKKSPKA